MTKVEGYVVVPPISKWDEEHRVDIEVDSGAPRFARTPRGAWLRHIGPPNEGMTYETWRLDIPRRIQFWFDRGYRIKRATIEIFEYSVDQTSDI